MKKYRILTTLFILMISFLFPNVHKAADSSKNNKQTVAYCLDMLTEVRPSDLLPNDIESDLRYCLAKAIAIDEIIDWYKRYKKMNH